MTSHIIVWAVLIFAIAYDIPTAMEGRVTISQAIRDVDHSMNGLIRWGWLALWCHLWVRTWTTP